MKHSAKPPVSKASAERFGHIYDQRIEKLAEMADGIEITKPTEETTKDNPEKCEVCQLTKAQRQVSRRVQAPTYGPLGRVHFDLIQIKEACNGDKWLTHFDLDGIRYHSGTTHPNKNGCKDAVVAFVSQLRTWFNIPIRAFHYDNECSAGKSVEQYLIGCGFIIERSIVGTPEMNSLSERSGWGGGDNHQSPRSARGFKGAERPLA